MKDIILVITVIIFLYILVAFYPFPKLKKYENNIKPRVFPKAPRIIIKDLNGHPVFNSTGTKLYHIIDDKSYIVYKITAYPNIPMEIKTEIALLISGKIKESKLGKKVLVE